MELPRFDEVTLPVLKYLSNEKEQSMSEVISGLEKYFSLSKEQINLVYPSGNGKVFRNRVYFARIHLIKAGLVEVPKKGHVKITKDGLKVVKENPPKIDIKYLKKFPIYKNFQENLRKRDRITDQGLESEVVAIPEDKIAEGYSDHIHQLTSDLREQVEALTFDQFEELVVDFIVKMGYGGNFEEAGKAIGKTGDGGVDGVIFEDKLGLDKIYIQAKHWKNCVGRPELQKFSGALDGVKANKGIFITTSYFSKDAVSFIGNIGNKRIILINGDELLELMIECGIGVSVYNNYQLKRVDLDYFNQESIL